MKFITVDKLKELINSNKIRLKDKEYFDELYHYQFYLKEIVMDWLSKRKKDNEKYKSSSSSNSSNYI
jgi:hypothetical protein